MDNLELLIGLLAIAVAVFFGMREFRKGIMSELSTIKDAVVTIRTTVDKTWDLIVSRFGTSGGTVERELQNLGKVKISAEPGAAETVYLIEIERPILKEEFFFKKAKEPEFLEKEVKLLGKERSPLSMRSKGEVTVLSANRLRYKLPCTDPKLCTEFITFVLKWLNSTYVESLKDIKQFEEPILT